MTRAIKHRNAGDALLAGLDRITAKREDKILASLQCENWNLKHPVGTPVILRMDTATIETKTRSEAYVAASGHAVCFFEGVSGYYLLERADPMSA